MNACGPEFFVAILTTCFSDSYEALEPTKAELRKMKLTDFPSENVIDCSAKVLRLAERLDSAGKFEPNLLCSVTRIFEHTTDERLKLFVYDKYSKCSALVKKLKVISIDSLRNDEVFTYEDLLKDFTEHYRMLVDSGRWSVSSNKKSNDPQLPAAYVSAINKSVTSALRQAGVSKGVPTCSNFSGTYVSALISF